jgi:hypothetical protein
VITADRYVGLENQGIHGRDAGRWRGTLDDVINELPDPVLTQVYCLKAVMGTPTDFGDVAAGHRRVVPLVGGTFTGPELNGSLLPGGTASWQVTGPDSTALTEIHCTLQTDRGALLYMRSSGVGRCHRDVAGEPLFHASTHFETADPSLDWLNTGVFVTVVGRTAVNMLHETYLVG